MPRTDDPNAHELERTAVKIVGDIESGAAAAAEKMLGAEGGPGGVKETRAAFLDYVRRNATQPEPLGAQWRQQFLQQMIVAIPNPYAQAEDGSDKLIPAKNGVAHVEDILKEAFPLGWQPAPVPPPMPPAPPMGAPMGVPPPPPPPMPPQPGATVMDPTMQALQAGAPQPPMGGTAPIPGEGYVAGAVPERLFG